MTKRGGNCLISLIIISNVLNLVTILFQHTNHLEKVFPAISVFNKALDKLHEVGFWCFNYRIIRLEEKTDHRSAIKTSNPQNIGINIGIS